MSRPTAAAQPPALADALGKPLPWLPRPHADPPSRDQFERAMDEAKEAVPDPSSMPGLPAPAPIVEGQRDAFVQAGSLPAGDPPTEAAATQSGALLAGQAPQPRSTDASGLARQGFEQPMEQAMEQAVPTLPRAPAPPRAQAAKDSCHERFHPRKGPADTARQEDMAPGVGVLPAPSPPPSRDTDEHPHARLEQAMERRSMEPPVPAPYAPEPTPAPIVEDKHHVRAHPRIGPTHTPPPQDGAPDSDLRSENPLPPLRRDSDEHSRERFEQALQQAMKQAVPPISNAPVPAPDPIVENRHHDRAQPRIGPTHTLPPQDGTPDSDLRPQNPLPLLRRDSDEHSRARFEQALQQAMKQAVPPISNAPVQAPDPIVEEKHHDRAPSRMAPADILRPQDGTPDSDLRSGNPLPLLRRDSNEHSRERFEQSLQQAMKQAVPPISNAPVPAPDPIVEDKHHDRAPPRMPPANILPPQDGTPDSDLRSQHSPLLQRRDSNEHSHERFEQALQQAMKQAVPPVSNAPVPAPDPIVEDRQHDRAQPRMSPTDAPPPQDDEPDSDLRSQQSLPLQRRDSNEHSRERFEQAMDQVVPAVPAVPMPAPAPLVDEQKPGTRSRPSEHPGDEEDRMPAAVSRDEAQQRRRVPRIARTAEVAEQPGSSIAAASSPSAHPPTQDHARERFQHAMEAGAPATPAVSGLPAAPTVEDQRDTRARERLVEAVERLMVGDVQGTQQVRMTLRDDVLPGVTVTVQQAAAQLQVVFECSVRASRQLIDRCAPAVARSLARRLGRDVVLQVEAVDDEGSPGLEVQAHASEAHE
jgi:hypothetical protein